MAKFAMRYALRRRKPPTLSSGPRAIWLRGGHCSSGALYFATDAEFGFIIIVLVSTTSKSLPRMQCVQPFRIQFALLEEFGSPHRGSESVVIRIGNPLSETIIP